MAAFDAVGPAGGAGAQATTSPLTWTHPGTASDTYVTVGVAVDSSADGAITVAVTYGGTTMTSVQRWESGGAAQSVGFVQAFDLVSPPTGSQTVSVAVTGAAFTRISGGSISFTAATTRSTPVHSDSNAVAVTTGSLGVPTTSASNVAVCFVADGTSPITFTAGTSRFASVGATQINAANNAGGATAAGTGGTVTFTWTQGADYYAATGFEVQGAAAAPGPAAPQPAAIPPGRGSPMAWRFRGPAPDLTPPPSNDVAVHAQLATGAGAALDTAFRYATAGLATAAGTAQSISFGQYITGISGSGAGQYFTDNTGQPRFLLADNPWGLIPNAGRWSGTYQTDIDTYCNNRGSQGYTGIYLDPLGNSGNNGPFADGRLYNGGSTTTWPFTVNGTPASTASLTGTETLALNNAFWTIVDYFIAACTRNGMTAMLNVGYSGPGDFASGGAYGSAGITATQFQQIGAGLAARYAATPNIIWLVGNDYTGGIGGTVGSGGGSPSVFDSLFTGLRTGLRGGGDTHVIAIHTAAEMDARQDFATGTAGQVQYWGNNFAEINGNYTYNVTYRGIENAYGETNPLLVMQLDGYFYQNAGSTSYWPPYDRAFRQDAWWAIASGARGHSHGSDTVWQWPSTALAETGTGWFYVHNAPNIRAVLEALPGWHTLLPDTASTLVTAGRGTRAGTIARPAGAAQYESGFGNSYVAAARTPDGGSGSSLALLYLPNATTVTIHAGSGGIVSGYTGTWYDPVTGAASSAGSGPTFNSTAKGNNSQGDPDWVLVLQAPAGTTATAQLATGTGTAQAARAAEGVNAALATGAGTVIAVTQTGNTANAVLATAAGAAQAVRAAESVNTVLAAGTGTAQAATVTTAVSPPATLAAGTGTAQAATTAAGVNAGLAAGTGTAQPAAVTTSSAATPTAVAATGTGAAQTGTIAAGVNAGTATGAGTSQPGIAAAGIPAAAATAAGTARPATVTVAVAPPATLATAAGTAQPAIAGLGVNATLAAAAGTAQTAAFTYVTAQLATGTGTAQGATVSTSSAANAPAGLATGTGTAQGATTAAGVNAALAAATGTAQTATVQTSAAATAPAQLAAATGTAQLASAAVTGAAVLATAAGAAPAATVTTSSSASAPAQAATGTGTAWPATVTISGTTNAPAQLAAGTGTAQAATASVTIHATLAASTGTALGIGHGTTAALATGTGTAALAVISITVQAAAAHAAAAALRPLAVPVEPFTVGALTAADQPAAVLTAAATPAAALTTATQTGGPS